MIYKHNGELYTDNSREISADTVFVKTGANTKYINDDLKNTAKKIITISEFAQIVQADKIKIVGITGTNGKTTTAAAIYSILLDLGFSCAMQGTRGFFIDDQRVVEKSLTTPSIFETLTHIDIALQKGSSFFVMEVSSHAIEQKRIESLDFALKIHTNITQDHLDYHGSLEEYRGIKNSFLQDETPKLINKDDKFVEFEYKNALTYALDSPASFIAPAYSLKDGIRCAIKHFDDIAEFSSDLHGIFNIYNLMCAVAAVKMLTDFGLQKICDQVENFAGVSGRMETVSSDPLVIVDFAHTPDGMYKVLDSLKDKTISVVFGAGGDRDRDKRAKMGAVASRFAKKIYVTSDNPRSEDPKSIISDIIKGISPNAYLVQEADRKKAIKTALEELESHESLLILGKGDETTQEIKGEFIPYDDRVAVRELLNLI